MQTPSPQGKAKRNGQERSLLKHKKAHPVWCAFIIFCFISRLLRNLRGE